MEGGEDTAAMGMMGMEEPDLYAGDSTDYSGWANFPKLLLRETVVNPYFGDLVRNDTVFFEFAAVKQGGFGLSSLSVLNPLALIKKGAGPGAFAAAAGLYSVSVAFAESAEKEVFFAGFAGAEDLESLKEVAAAKGKLLFPGVLAGWSS
jgi:hypothetical protein